MYFDTFENLLANYNVLVFLSHFIFLDFEKEKRYIGVCTNFVLLVHII